MSQEWIQSASVGAWYVTEQWEQVVGQYAEKRDVSLWAF